MSRTIVSVSSLSFDEFAQSGSMRCTEVYEYSRALAEGGSNTTSPAGFTIPSFQIYKFIYTLRLVDHGLYEEVRLDVS